MSRGQAKTSFIPKSIQNLIERIADIKSTDPFARIVTIADRESTCARLKIAISENLKHVLPDAVDGNAPSVEKLLFNVNFMTFESLLKNFWEESFFDDKKDFLPRHTLLYACQCIKNTLPELSFSIDLLVRIYEYIRYQNQDILAERIIQYLPRKTVIKYISQVYQLIQPNYVDQLDVVNHLLLKVSEDGEYTNKYKTKYIAFKVNNISIVEKKFYTSIINLTYSCDLDITKKLQKKYSEIDRNFDSSQSGKNDTSLEKEMLSQSSSMLSESNTFDQVGEDQEKNSGVTEGFLNNQEDDKFSNDIFSHRNTMEEVHAAFRWIAECFALGAQPSECAVVYFGTEHYKAIIQYESEFFQVGFGTYKNTRVKKNTFLELIKLIMKIDPKAVTSGELVQLLEKVFALSDISLWSAYGDILSDVVNLAQDIGSIAFWRRNISGIIRQNELDSVLVDIVDLLAGCLEEDKMPESLPGAIAWIEGYIEKLLECLKNDQGKWNSSYATYQMILGQITQDAADIGNCTTQCLPDVIDYLLAYEADISASDIYVSPIEEACSMPFRYVAILGCSSELLDNTYPRPVLEQILDKYVTDSQVSRFSYTRFGFYTKDKVSFSKTLLSLLPLREITYSPNNCRDFIEEHHQIPPYSYSDVVSYLLQESFVNNNLWVSTTTATPIAIYFSLQALLARSNAEFNEYTGHLPGVIKLLERENFFCSATSLERYQKCPFSYFLKDILNLEGEKYSSDYLAPVRSQIGIAVHKILEIYIKIIQSSNCLNTPEANFISALRNCYGEQIIDEYTYLDSGLADMTERLEGVLSVIADLEFNKLYSYSDSILKDFIANIKQKWLYHLLLWNQRYLNSILDGYRSTVAGEYKFSDVPIMQVQGEEQTSAVTSIRVSGAIDRVDRLGEDTFCIIDYKTGSPDKYQKLKRDSRHVRTLLQLPIYVDIYRSKSNLEQYLAVYDFIAQPEKNIELSVDEDMLTEIHTVIGEISRLMDRGVFPQNPGKLSQGVYENCRSCDYRSVCSDAQRTSWSVLKSEERIEQYLNISE
jgi:CRISPR/Cas system-associated exonuclease Cas4 (RecB family)